MRTIQSDQPLNQTTAQPTLQLAPDRLARLLVQWVPNRGARMALALCIMDEARTHDATISRTIDRSTFLAAVAGIPTARDDSD